MRVKNYERDDDREQMHYITEWTEQKKRKKHFQKYCYSEIKYHTRRVLQLISLLITRTYTVQPGETVFGISKNLYGSSGYYSAITDKNDVSESCLDSGSKLKIPKLW